MMNRAEHGVAAAPCRAVGRRIRWQRPPSLPAWGRGRGRDTESKSARGAAARRGHDAAGQRRAILPIAARSSRRRTEGQQQTDRGLEQRGRPAGGLGRRGGLPYGGALGLLGLLFLSRAIRAARGTCHRDGPALVRGGGAERRLEPSSHQAIKPSSHQAIKWSGASRHRASGRRSRHRAAGTAM